MTWTDSGIMPELLRRFVVCEISATTCGSGELIEIVQLVKAFAILWLLGPGQAISSHFVVTTKTYQHRSVWPKETSELCKKNLKKKDKWWPSSNSSNYSIHPTIPHPCHTSKCRPRARSAARIFSSGNGCAKWCPGDGETNSKISDPYPTSGTNFEVEEWNPKAVWNRHLSRHEPSKRGSSLALGHQPPWVTKKVGSSTWKPTWDIFGIIFLGWKQIGAKSNETNLCKAVVVRCRAECPARVTGRPARACVASWQLGPHWHRLT